MRLLSALALSASIVFPESSCAKLFNNTRSEHQQYPAHGLKIYAHPALNDYGSFSHACKMSDGKRYLAALGTYKGMVFVDYTDRKIEDKDIQFFPGAPSFWRECRSYRDPKTGNVYVYTVTEGERKTFKIVDGKPDFNGYQGGIQIFKLGRSSVEFVGTYVGNFHTAHTIFIDTARGLAFVNGSNWRGQIAEEHKGYLDHLGSLRILDIATDPENPRDLGGYSASYTHDSYALGEVNVPSRLEFDLATGQDIKIDGKIVYVLYLADILKGYIHVLNVSDPANLKLESSVHTPLHNQGVSVHNLWASEDKKWLFATEETTGSSLLVYDISNPIKPRFVTAYRSEKVADTSIIHNVVVKGRIAYCSWYKEGVRLVDISNPVHPREFAFFDSSIKDFSENDEFHGNWSVDVDDRGLMIISDIEEGLFILQQTK